MSNVKFIANRLREVLLSGKWIANTNVKEQISKVGWEASMESPYGLNSIALLTFHLNYYLSGLINVFEVGTLEIRDKYSFDLSPIENQFDWDVLVKEFLDNAESFISHIESMDEEKLEQDFVDAKYGNYYRNLEGVIEHSYYHLGQMVLINKILEAKKT